MTATVALQQFLERLFRPGDGLIELRSLPSKSRCFVEPGAQSLIERFVDEHINEDIYFGVAARRDSSSGRLENCTRVRAVFVDLDFKSFNSPDEAQRKLDFFPLKPSLIVNSGGGIHAYWLLGDPIVLSTGAAAFRNLLRRTARALSADLASAEPARVLRLPGTFNHKYSPPREVKLVG
jgi:hypothetical protein